MRNPARPATVADCSARINRAIDFVVSHLAQPLRLEDVAAAALVSPFHFHRIFRALTGETLNAFITRLRLEKALTMMSHHRRKTLTEVALASGFSSPSDFARCFRQRFGVAPSRYDLAAHRERQREALKATMGDPQARHLLDRLPPGANPDGFEVTLRDLPARTVAYIRVVDSFRDGAVPEAAQRLVAWAEPRGLADRCWFGYMWDDPDVVALADCRYDVAVEVDEVQPRGEIGRFVFPPMRVAQVPVRGGIDLETRALDWLYGTWLPASGYVPANLPSFEAWVGRPFAHGLAYFELDVWLPVEKA